MKQRKALAELAISDAIHTWGMITAVISKSESEGAGVVCPSYRAKRVHSL